MLRHYRTQALSGPIHNKNARDVVVCIAGGPSLTKTDISLCEQSSYPLLGINNAYQITDRLTYHYACDTKWWQHHYPYTQAHTRKFSLNGKQKDEGYPGVEQMKRGGREALSHEWPILGTGGNSGFQAVNLAYLLGYKTIILLGYDLSDSGGTHWHPDHNFSGSTNPSKGTFGSWIRAFNKVAPELKKANVEVLNATRSTALKCFPLVKLEGVL